MIQLSFQTFLIVCPLVFLAGFVDAIGGGGGLISLPAYMLAGVPTHMAIATNKLSSACGTAVTTGRFIRKRLVNLKLAVPTVLAALAGAWIGARISLGTDETVLKWVMLPVLCIAACFVLNKKLFGSRRITEEAITARTCLIASVSACIIGVYDGFYGPGTGTFLIIALNVFAHLPIQKCNAQAKVINLTTNLMSLAVFLLNGQVVWMLGLAGAACNMLGNYLGSSLAIEKGERITRPVILLVLLLLFIKIITGS